MPSLKHRVWIYSDTHSTTSALSLDSSLDCGESVDSSSDHSTASSDSVSVSTLFFLRLRILRYKTYSFFFLSADSLYLCRRGPHASLAASRAVLRVLVREAREGSAPVEGQGRGAHRNPLGDPLARGPMLFHRPRPRLFFVHHILVSLHKMLW